MNRDVDFFNTCAENWDSIRNTNPQTLEKLMELADIPAGANILDVGSGTGVLLPSRCSGSAGKNYRSRFFWEDACQSTREVC